jgi:Glycosyl transferase family 2
MPAFSVVIPAHNEAAHIVSAIASVQAQTEKDLEIIVIDDCSTDDTANAVLQIAEHDRRIRMLSLAVNGGLAAARNLGFDQANGEWIAILDADDTFEPTRLSSLLDAGVTTNADMVADVVYACVGDHKFPLWNWHDTKPMSLLEFLEAERNGKFRLWPGWPVIPRPRVIKRRNPIGFIHPIFRRSFLDRHHLRYQSRLRTFEDFLFYVECFMHGARFWITPDALYYYSVREGSLSSAARMADLEIISATWSRLLKSPEFGDHRMQAAGRSLKRDVDRWHAYVVFTRAIKAGDLGGAARTLFGSFTNLLHILDESLVQVPVVVAKALRGGYGHYRGEPRVGANQSAKPQQNRLEKNLVRLNGS